MSTRSARTPAEGSARQPEAAFEGVSVIGFKNTQAGIEHFTLRDDDHVVARSDLVTTENLSDQSLSSVSDDGPSNLASDRDSQAADAALICQREQRGITPVEANPVLVNVLKLRALPDSLDAPESSQAIRR
jgi:hypothetical protein